jgi:hypothetical protein
MALTGIVHLAERLLSQSQSEAQTEQSALETIIKVSPQNFAPAKSLAISSADAFTASAQAPAADATAQAAGLFSVATSSLFSAAANLLRGPVNSTSATSSSSSAVNSARTPAANSPAVSVTNASAASKASSVNSPGPATAVATSPDLANDSDVAAVPPPLASVTRNATTSSELQGLNNLLAADGLSASDIAEVDNFARSSNDYHPTDYLKLVHQLQTAEQSQSPASTATSEQNATNAINLNAPTIAHNAATITVAPKVSSAIAGASKP